MRGIKFTDGWLESNVWHTADNWGLVMTLKSIGVPPIKEKYIELKDRDGILDLTDALTGLPAYGTRTLSFDFEYLDDSKKWTEVFTDICNTLHGRRLWVVEPDDPDHYYIGRVFVGEPTGGLVKSFTITVKADAWRYKKDTTKSPVNTPTSGMHFIVKNGGRAHVSLTIVIGGSVTFEFNGVSYSFSSGSHTSTGIRLAPGDNDFYISQVSANVIMFVFREAVI